MFALLVVCALGQASPNAWQPSPPWAQPSPGYASASYAGLGYAGIAFGGLPIYGGLPSANMFPGSYGASPLPYAGPLGFGTFSASGPVAGYSAPLAPIVPPWRRGP